MQPILNAEETHVVGTRAILDQDILPAGMSPASHLTPNATFLLTVIPRLPFLWQLRASKEAEGRP